MRISTVANLIFAPVAAVLLLSSASAQSRNPIQAAKDAYNRARQ
jgi:hypothetical protein